MMEACVNQSASDEKSGSLEKNCVNFDSLAAEMETKLRTGSFHELASVDVLMFNAARQ